MRQCEKCGKDLPWWKWKKGTWETPGPDATANFSSGEFWVAFDCVCGERHYMTPPDAMICACGRRYRILPPKIAVWVPDDE